ncbi:NAD(P)-dependent dehydrogenase, short-chain alcohol dehydrogenase family [Persephonella hydrogeniphila]|uniref:NAD(P)-dependent dehydrogenase, short-chain alcohol dehydrogenase family n=1 Tax=Persephonella hydrogeniphila TaxID=198703 RepID=A0A285N347_9AQUI|nr:NAD(P)-dependent dehydrogenase, short-chain alcohol dehydrogenase family [Persephonella hydrogeniphila]
MDIKGKNVLITGCAKRIGRYMALSLAEEGANIVIHYRSSKEEAEKLLEELRKKNIKAVMIKADLEKSDEIRKLAENSLKEMGRIDVLINNASIYYPTPIEKVKEEDLDRFYNVHIKAPFILSQIIGQSMLKNKQGRIINIVDYSPLRPYKNFSPYAVSKGGLLTMTRALAKEFAPHVLVNAVLPGPIIPAEGVEDTQKPLEKTLLKKWGGEKEVYKAVKYLIETDFTTGAFIPVEGGRLIC